MRSKLPIVAVVLWLGACGWSPAEPEYRPAEPAPEPLQLSGEARLNGRNVPNAYVGLHSETFHSACQPFATYCWGGTLSIVVHDSTTTSSDGTFAFSPESPLVPSIECGDGFFLAVRPQSVEIRAWEWGAAGHHALDGLCGPSEVLIEQWFSSVEGVVRLNGEPLGDVVVEIHRGDVGPSQTTTISSETLPMFGGDERLIGQYWAHISSPAETLTDCDYAEAGAYVRFVLPSGEASEDYPLIDYMPDDCAANPVFVIDADFSSEPGDD